MNASELHPVVSEIIATLQLRYKHLNLHYEAAWTDSWTHRRCWHTHETLIEAAKCGMPQGAGWYVIAVECERPRELTNQEAKIVDIFRFGLKTLNTAVFGLFQPK